LGYVLLDQEFKIVNNCKFSRVIETSDIEYNKTATAQKPKRIFLGMGVNCAQASFNFSALFQKLTVKTDSIDSKSYLQKIINPLLVFKKFSDLIEDIGFRISQLARLKGF